MKELSLFTGAGGGLLGTKLLGFTHIGYVENNEYCQKIIAQRIKDGILDEAPIFSDVRTFISEGYAESYQGMVDVITAGFPCQGNSAIGKQKVEFDHRNMWPETIATIKKVRPKYFKGENVKNLASKKYICTIVSDLEQAGYAVWPILQLGAYCCGAKHKRERIWIFADSTSGRLERRDRFVEKWEATDGSISALVQIPVWPDVSNPKSYGSYDGLADRVERTRSIGNGQVPVVAATAWRLLSGGLG